MSDKFMTPKLATWEVIVFGLRGVYQARRAVDAVRKHFDECRPEIKELDMKDLAEERTVTFGKN